MKQTKSLSSFPEGTTLKVEIDMTGSLKKIFELPSQVPGCLFLLCTRGNCSVTIHLNKYELKKGSMAIIFPEIFFQVVSQSPDCRFILAGFDKELSKSSSVFSKTIEYLPHIIEEPVIHLPAKVAELYRDTFLLLIKALHTDSVALTQEQIKLTYTQILLGLGNIYKQDSANHPSRYNRNQEIAKDLLRVIIQNYRTERSISFYAEQMHLSPQHLSTTIKKTTGKTLTEIISTFVIRDAQAKLRSTELTIQEIAYSLNFSDISFFGKYFKRYTGMSPKQYRNME